MTVAAEPTTTLVLAADNDAGSHYIATTTQHKVEVVVVELKRREVQLVLPVRARKLTLTVNNLSSHRSTAAVGIARVEHDACIVHFIPTLTLLNGHEGHLVTTL